MKLILFRHATRSPYEIGDASLNPNGLAQAAALPGMIAPNGPIPHPTHLFSSPKKRARQTLEAVSSAFGLPVIVDDNLDERRNAELSNSFDRRVESVFQRMSKLPPDSVVILCSHLDWLEAALNVWPIDLNQSINSWAAGDFRIFELVEGVCESQGSGSLRPIRR